MVANGATVIGGPVNEEWFGAVNQVARETPWLHTPARDFAGYGVVLFAAVLLLSWWLARGDRDVRRVSAALWAPVGALLALGVNQLLVAAVAEPRPYTVFPGALALVPHSSDPGFPSDHAVMAGAVAAGVLLANRTLGVATAVMALLMAADRVYVGAHFPLDVVAGLVVGAAVSLTGYVAARSLWLRLVLLLSRTPVRPLLTAPPGWTDR